jgi:hypothetical protein
VAGPTRAAPRKATFCDLHHRLLLNALITCRLAAAPSLNPPDPVRSPGAPVADSSPGLRFTGPCALWRAKYFAALLL